MLTQDHLTRIGRHVRRSVQKWVFIDSFGADDPVSVRTMKGACAIASVAFNQVLEDVYSCPSTLVTTEVPSWFGGNNCHCWVEVADLVVDVTATQFDVNLPDVYIVPRDDYEVAELDESFQSSEAITYRGHDAMQRLPRWRKSQNPLTYAANIAKLIRRLSKKAV